MCVCAGLCDICLLLCHKVPPWFDIYQSVKIQAQEGVGNYTIAPMTGEQLYLLSCYVALSLGDPYSGLRLVSETTTSSSTVIKRLSAEEYQACVPPAPPAIRGESSRSDTFYQSDERSSSRRRAKRRDQSLNTCVQKTPGSVVFC